ncbi:MAG TPA: response regulator, partial [Cyclobacteriaceae bacterium]|nr:response regulator [Cyclobacteriaceae bacterium]
MHSLLLVEDDVRIADDLKLRLHEEGFEVLVVYDGLLAERLIMRSPFHCVLLDVNLPGKNGFDIC